MSEPIGLYPASIKEVMNARLNDTGEVGVGITIGPRESSEDKHDTLWITKQDARRLYNALARALRARAAIYELTPSLN